MRHDPDETDPRIRYRARPFVCGAIDVPDRGLLGELTGASPAPLKRFVERDGLVLFGGSFVSEAMLAEDDRRLRWELMRTRLQPQPLRGNAFLRPAAVTALAERHQRAFEDAVAPFEGRHAGLALGALHTRTARASPPHRCGSSLRRPRWRCRSRTPRPCGRPCGRQAGQGVPPANAGGGRPEDLGAALHQGPDACPGASDRAAAPDRPGRARGAHRSHPIL